MPEAGSTKWSADPTRLRRLVLGAAVLSTLLKLVIASRTFGTNDVHYWADFAEGVERYRPIGVYGQPPAAADAPRRVPVRVKVF